MPLDNNQEPSIKGILIDLDGTLIGPDERITCRVLHAVKKIAKLIAVSIATGREPRDVIKYARELNLTAPQISDNGALILDPNTKQGLWSAPLGRSNSTRVMEVIASRNYDFIATHPGGTIDEKNEINHLDLIRISALNLEERIADNLVKEMTDTETMNIVKVFLPYNGLWAVDFTDAGVNKATAANKMASMVGIKTSQFAAIGDSYNDLPMLKVAGLSIAMGNAPDELKDAANYVAPTTSDDGLAVAINEFILPKLM